METCGDCEQLCTPAAPCPCCCAARAFGPSAADAPVYGAAVVARAEYAAAVARAEFAEQAARDAMAVARESVAARNAAVIRAVATRNALRRLLAAKTYACTRIVDSDHCGRTATWTHAQSGPRCDMHARACDFVPENDPGWHEVYDVAEIREALAVLAEVPRG